MLPPTRRFDPSGPPPPPPPAKEKQRVHPEIPTGTSTEPYGNNPQPQPFTRSAERCAPSHAPSPLAHPVSLILPGIVQRLSTNGGLPA